MERHVSFALAKANSNSNVLDIMKSKYPCIYQPMNTSNTKLEEEEEDVDEDRRYLTPLWVFGTRDIDEPESPLPPSFLNMMVEQNIIDPHIIKQRITSALKGLRFREKGVLVQFWSPIDVRKRWLLTAWNQPFGIGVANEWLYSYRLKSELRAIVVDGEDREELGPPGRVYSQKLPEWSLDVDDGNNMYGYIDLPVFESSGDSCVGVLEIITSSNYIDYAFEVQEVSKALKLQNLRSPSIFEDASFCASARAKVADAGRRQEHDEIYMVLKPVCDTHDLPLAQTWAPSGHTSYVDNSGNIEHCCSSFNRSCIGKVCMSTHHLPFYVRDLSLWEFRKACSETHLEKSHGVVGTSFSSRGTMFFRDVTELDEDDYPLVRFARKSGITSCVAIYITSHHDEYVIEFLLPISNANEAELLKLTNTLKEQLKNTSLVQSDIMLAPKPLFNENEENIENESSNSASVGPSPSVDPYLEKHVADFDTNPAGKTRMKGKRFGLGEVNEHYEDMLLEVMPENSDNESSNSGYVGTKRKRKRSERVISLEEIQKHTRKPIDEVAAIHNDSMSMVGHSFTNQQEQTNLPHVRAQPKMSVIEQHIENTATNTVKYLTVEATYKENTVRFPFILSDGLVTLEELIAKRFLLRIGSFKLKYEDKDGDMILIAIDKDLEGSVGDSRQPVDPTVIKLVVKDRCPSEI